MRLRDTPDLPRTHEEKRLTDGATDLVRLSQCDLKPKELDVLTKAFSPEIKASLSRVARDLLASIEKNS